MKKLAATAMGAVALFGASSVALASLPTFTMTNQTFSTLSPDMFFLGDNFPASPAYKVSITSSSDSSYMGNFSVYSADAFNVFTGISGSSVSLGAGAFSDGTPASFFTFTAPAGKPLFATVTGFGTNVAYDLHVTPVPEAETWSMMVAGLGLLGWYFSSRRQTAEEHPEGLLPAA